MLSMSLVRSYKTAMRSNMVTASSSISLGASLGYKTWLLHHPRHSRSVMPSSSLLLHRMQRYRNLYMYKRRTHVSFGSFTTNRSCYFVGIGMFLKYCPVPKATHRCSKCRLGIAATVSTSSRTIFWQPCLSASAVCKSFLCRLSGSRLQ